MIFIFLGAVFLLLLFYAWLLKPGKRSGNASQELLHFPNGYAHRGLHKKDKTVPENSLIAFEAAADRGYGMELDVNLTADGKVVVFHDDSLLRVCGVDKLLNDCTYKELLTYRLCGTEEKIPLFSDVLALVDGRTPLLVELKHSKRNDELCQKTAKLLDGYKGAYCIESFHPGIVRWFRKNRPDVVRGQLSGGTGAFSGIPVWQALTLSLLPPNVATRPHFVAYRHQDAHSNFPLCLFRLLGGTLMGWTIRDTDDYKYCKKRFDVLIFEFFMP